MPKLPLDEQESIRGCQYTSRKFRRLGARVGLTQSMGATGVCWDNSPAEAFFASLKRELVHPVHLGNPGRHAPGGGPLDRGVVQLPPALLAPLLHPDREGDHP
jgi:transposase InsO family protein